MAHLKKVEQDSPDGDVVNDDAEVGVEPHVRWPRVGELLLQPPALRPEVVVGHVRNVLQDEEDVGDGHACGGQNKKWWVANQISVIYDSRAVWPDVELKI